MESYAMIVAASFSLVLGCAVPHVFLRPQKFRVIRYFLNRSRPAREEFNLARGR